MVKIIMILVFYSVKKIKAVKRFPFAKGAVYQSVKMHVCSI
jgi:hypothetical protein